METGNTGEQVQATDYSWLEIRKLKELRKQQAEIISQHCFENNYEGGLDAFDKAHEALAPQLDGELEDLVGHHIPKDEQPEKYDTILSFLKSVSSHRMSDRQWFSGDLGSAGKPEYSTSGSYKARKLYAELSATPEEPAATDPSEEITAVPLGSPDILAGRAAVIETRNKLAPLSLSRRQRSLKHGKKANTLAAQYDEAKTAYDEALSNLTTLYVAKFREQGLDPDEIREKVLPTLIDLHRDFTQAEYDILKNDNSLRGRAARFLSKRGAIFGLSAASGVGIGIAARVISKSVQMAVIGITGGAAAGGLIAARYTKNIMLANVRNRVALYAEFEKRRDQDLAASDKHRETAKTLPLDEAILSVNAKIGAIITERVEKDRRSNLKRVVISAAIGGIAAGATEAISAFGPDIYHDIFGNTHSPSIAGSTSASPAPSTPAVPATPVTPEGPTNIEIPSGQVTVGGSPSEAMSGFSPNIVVEPGHGFIQEIQEMAAQNGYQLSSAQATNAYHYVLNGKGSNFFTDDPTYTYQGDFRISRPGFATWDPSHFAAIQQWLAENEKVAA